MATRDITLTFEDGTSHQYKGVPDNVTPDQVMERVGKEFSEKKLTNIDGGRSGNIDNEPLKSDEMGMGMAATRGAIQGATLGLAPKISAAGRAYAVDPFLDWLKFTGIGAGGSGQTYQQLRDQYNAENEKAITSHPVAYIGGSMLGSAPAAVATGGSIRGLAGIGALQGAGETGDTNTDVATNMIKNAGINTALGFIGAAPTKIMKAGPAWLKKDLMSPKIGPDGSIWEGMTEKEAEHAIKSNKGESGTLWTVTKGLGQNTLDVVKTGLGGVAGGVAGGYAGEKLAPLFGLSPQTGEILGAELGGGAGVYGAYKKGLINEVRGNANQFNAMFHTTYPWLQPAITGAISAAIPAVNAHNVSGPGNPYNNIDEVEERKPLYRGAIPGSQPGPTMQMILDILGK